MNDRFTTIQFLLDSIASFNAARDWDKWHTPSHLARSICIEAAELLENFQWDYSEAYESHLKQELADIVIYCLSFANVCEIDISTAVSDKLKHNGKKYPIADEIEAKLRVDVEERR